MAIFEVTGTEIRAIPRTNFAKEGLKARADLQRLLQRSIEHISPDTTVLAEEFGSWDESLRRIDLLGLDKECRLVVIELKRTAGRCAASPLHCPPVAGHLQRRRHKAQQSGQAEAQPRGH